MGRNCAMAIFMTLLIWFCFHIVNTADAVGEEAESHIEAYLQGAEDQSAVEVAAQKPMKLSGGVSYSGPVYVIDHLLTETPNPKSRVLGIAQGLYSLSSEGKFKLLMAMTFSIHSGKFKGGELNIAGKHIALREQKELPVVGGSGLFRMGRGYAFAHSHSNPGQNSVIGYNVTVFHSAH